MPRATDDPPMVYSRIKAHPISQATLDIVCQEEEQNAKVREEPTFLLMMDTSVHVPPPSKAERGK